ncbi:MAG: peptidoglycan bridge formation glycyltransferase FemA/FemB family protein [Candidatus Pacebacteria bacterium]|nr:peptidoglycan bridge formation glycyltransferase FemA/FemB family protein [Candidatus Paceibacterota bacterium]
MIDYSISKKEWDNFLKEKKGSFLQSVEWGDFKKKYQEVERIQLKESNKIKGVCQFFKENNKLGRYFYIPFGPVSDDEKVKEELLKEVIKIARKKKVLFIKIESKKHLNFGVKSYHRIQPKKTSILNIEEDSDLLLKKFRKSTRYNIKQAVKKGVTIEKGETIEDFFKILEETKERQGFSTYSKDYFQELVEKNSSDVFLAKHKGKVIAGSIVLYFGEVATYLHSAFDYRYQNMNGTALIVFESIKQSRKNGCKYYDFWGLDEKKYLGVTKFKKGFKGEEVVYEDTKDIPLKKGQYFIYYLASVARSYLK